MQPSIIKNPSVAIDPDLLNQLHSLTQEEGQVIIHCCTKASIYSDLQARVQKTTFLFDLDSDHQSDLIYADNISIAPEWSLIPKGKQRAYSLIFSGLPKSCSSFDLLELNEPCRAFFANGIQRNKKDVYFLQL